MPDPILHRGIADTHWMCDGRWAPYTDQTVARQIASTVKVAPDEWVSTSQRSEALMTFVRSAPRILIAAASMSALFLAAACGWRREWRTRRRWDVCRPS